MNRFINILLLLVFSLGVWAQNDSVPVSDVPEIEYGMTRKTYEIAGIEVEGADSYEDFVLIGFSGLAVGDKIEVPGDQITKAIKRFWKQGLFSSVKIKAKKIEGSKIWLVIELAQRPRISEVRYEGLKKSEREDVEVKAGIRQGSQMTPNLEDHAKTVIKKYLAEKGFHNAEVHVIQQNDTDHPGYVKVLIGVDKKVKTKVGKIYITGNENLTHRQINKAMKKTNDNDIINLFRTKKFVREEYEKDKQAVIEKYNEHGFRDAYIVADSVVPNPEDPNRVCRPREPDAADSRQQERRGPPRGEPRGRLPLRPPGTQAGTLQAEERVGGSVAEVFGDGGLLPHQRETERHKSRTRCLYRAIYKAYQ